MGSRIRIDPTTRVPIGDEGSLVSAPGVPPELSEELLALRRTIEARTSRYVELSCRTSFSFLAGATPPEAMVFRAAELGYDTLAITDRDGLYGIVRACEEAQKHGIRIIVGCELTLENEGLEGVPDVPGKPTTLTVLVENHAGYTNLCRILTESHRRHPKSLPTKRTNDLDEDELPRNVFAGVPLSFVCAHAEGLWALADAGLPIAELHRAFGPRLSIAAHLHKDGEDRARVGRVLDASRTHGVPICATNRVLFARPGDKPILDVVTCIREGKTLDEAGRELLPNTEGHLKSEEEILRLFSLHPDWIARSRFVADRCRFSMKELSYRFPYELSDLVHRDFRGEVGESAVQALARLTWEGARVRYGEGGAPPKVREQIEKELALIEKLEVAPYFLSVRAIVDIARRRDILCQGRGSAANSAVCYCLGITAVDPARSNMLFERFLSAERREPPDIDVDFEHERREEVIQEIYETYGRDRAAMVCEIISYRAKSALREVGKVFGFSLEQVERLASVVSWWDGVSSVSEERLKNAGFSASDPRVRQTLVMARAVQGFPRHLSIHVGGFVLSAAPLTEVAPIEPATMQGRTIVPWDKDDIDTLGFFKIDVLGLGMLTAIRKCLDLVRPVAAEEGLRSGTAIERLARIPAEDPVVYDALCNADTVGVFQIESRAQMAMLPRLRPRRFYDLVIEVAIVRPGPIQGGMVHPYLRRRTGEERADPPHPLLRPILERTLGVPLFQEQVMQIAIVGAGYSGGEADRLRRDMAAWRKNGSLEKHHGRLLEGFRERGIPESFGERLYQQIHGFAEYGFPECVVGDTLVLDASTGQRVRIEDIAKGRVKVKTTLACDASLCLRQRRVLEARPSGAKEVFRLRTALGRELVATANHPLRTARGWTALGDLRAGDRVAAARCLPALGRRHVDLSSTLRTGDDALAPDVFEIDLDELADFVARLWERDGTLTFERQASLRAASETLASQVQHLLLRFGVVAKVERTAVTVADRESLARFADRIGSRFYDPYKRILARGIAKERGVAPENDVVWDRIVSIEPAGVQETYDLTIEGDHNFLANDFVVHNSHSSSFALLVYASAWLKVHYPAEFASALINSQPMGFYSPSTILQDAQRHGVKLLAIDAAESGWDCACVPHPHPSEGGKTAIRLGLRLVSGLGEDAGRRIEEARAEGPFASVDDVIVRARLDKKEVHALAESGALDALAGGRRQAIWKVVAPRPAELFEDAPADEAKPKLRSMSRAEQLVLDYERTGVSVEDHPMRLLRPSLGKKVRSSRDLMALRSGTRVTTAGLVICRQRPGTASGVVFVTMEDEFGFSNLVLWAKTFEKFRHVATTARLLLVHGRIERSDDRSPDGRLKVPDPNAAQSVVYVVADKLERLDAHMPALASMSRDFH